MTAAYWGSWSAWFRHVQKAPTCLDEVPHKDLGDAAHDDGGGGVGRLPRDAVQQLQHTQLPYQPPWVFTSAARQMMHALSLTLLILAFDKDERRKASYRSSCSSVSSFSTSLPHDH